MPQLKVPAGSVEFFNAATDTANLVAKSSLLLSASSLSPRLRRGIGILGTATATVSLAKDVYQIWKSNGPSSRRARSLVVYEGSASYSYISSILYNDEECSSSERSEESVALTVSEYYDEGGDIALGVSDNKSFSGKSEILGFSVEVSFVPSGIPASRYIRNDHIDVDYDADLGSESGRSTSKKNQFVLTFKDSTDRSNFFDALENEVKDLERSSPTLFRATTGGYIRRVSNILPRDTDSVFLKSGQMERLVDGIEMFQKSEDLYSKIGIPYHTGILLSGPPGTGKTSTLVALANHFHMDVVFINLSSIGNDDGLAQCVGEVSPDTLIILEDVDTVYATRTRGGVEVDVKPSDSSVTLGGLLNVLDGQMSPHGCVFGLTTNHLDKIDPALYRDGRIEYREDLGYMDDHQFRKFYNYVFDKDPVGFPEVRPEYKITPATIAGVLRRDISNFPVASEKIRTFILEKEASSNES